MNMQCLNLPHSRNAKENGLRLQRKWGNRTSEGKQRKCLEWKLGCMLQFGSGYRAVALYWSSQWSSGLKWSNGLKPQGWVLTFNYIDTRLSEKINALINHTRKRFLLWWAFVLFDRHNIKLINFDCGSIRLWWLVWLVDSLGKNLDYQ